MSAAGRVVVVTVAPPEVPPPPPVVPPVVVPVEPVVPVDAGVVAMGVVTVTALVVTSRYAGLDRSPPRNIAATTVPTGGGVTATAAVAGAVVVEPGVPPVPAGVVSAQAQADISVPSTWGTLSWQRPRPSGSALFATVA